MIADFMLVRNLGPEGGISEVLAVFLVVTMNTGRRSDRLQGTRLAQGGPHTRRRWVGVDMVLTPAMAALTLHTRKPRGPLRVHKTAVKAIADGVTAQALGVELALLLDEC